MLKKFLRQKGDISVEDKFRTCKYASAPNICTKPEVKDEVVKLPYRSTTAGTTSVELPSGYCAACKFYEKTS